MGKYCTQAIGPQRPLAKLDELERGDRVRRGLISAASDLAHAVEHLAGLRIRDQHFCHVIASERDTAQFLGLDLFGGVPRVGDRLLLPKERLLVLLTPERIFTTLPLAEFLAEASS